MVAVPHFVLMNRRTQQVVRKVPVGHRETLYEALERLGLPIRTSCRGSTICGQCWVYVEDEVEELPSAAPDERALLDRFAEASPQVRLACRLRLPKERSSIVVSTTYWGAP